MSIRELQEQVHALAQAVKQYCSNRSCSCYGGPHNGGNCLNFFNHPPQHRMETYSCDYCGGIPHPGFDCQTGNTPNYDQVMIAKQGTCPSMIRLPVTIKTLVLTNLHSILHISNSSSIVVRSVEVPVIALIVKPGTSLSMSLILDLVFDSLMHTCKENNCILEEMLKTQMPNSPIVLKESEGSGDYMEVTYDKEKCLSDHYTAPITSPAFTSSIPFLATMEPADILLMGDEVISTTPIREDDEFIKSSVDYLVPILRESEVTLDSVLECDMPATTPLPLLIIGK
ncbi:hypothetical protein Tco_1182213 [Tanacetum coccineum]